MPVIQISKVIHCLGTSGELPDRLELGQLGMATDTGDVLIGATGLPQVAGRKSYPYENLKILTELDVQKTMTGDVYHHGPLYSQDLDSAAGVMDVPLFMQDTNQTAQYGNYDYSFTSSLTSQMGEVMVALNGSTPHVTSTAYVWGLITSTTFTFSSLLVNGRVILRVSWTPSDLGTEIYKFHMAGREWSAIVAPSSGGGGGGTPGPLPTQIIDLVATAMSPTTVQLTYTNAENAISHEYRMNGGVPTPMPSDKLIVGLTSKTTYNFEVRGINANGNGPWSNVAAATTPGTVQSYPDSYTVKQGRVLTIQAPGVLANDTTTSGPPQAADLVTSPAHGTLSLDSGGGFTYTPDITFYGTDQFTYRAWDGTQYGDPATVTITVLANTAPVAANNSYSLTQNTTLTVLAPGVLGNDSDADNDSLVASLVSSPTQGTLTFNADGSFAYTPPANYTGTQSFTYHVSDGIAYSNIATVTLSVVTATVVDTAPVAVNNTYNGTMNTPLVIAAPGILGNDTDAEGDKLAVAAITQNPAHGILSITKSTGAFTYTPSANWYGTDLFKYTATDGTKTSNVATVTINIAQVVQADRAPVTTPDSYTTNEDTILSVPAPGVLTNDSDPDGDPMTAVLATNVSHGTLTLRSNGSFTYTPNANFNGTDSFTYKASDGTLTSAATTVTIHVTAVNDPDVFVPVADKTVSYSTTTLPSSASWGIFPDGTLKTGQTTSPITVYANWLTNTADGVIHNPGAYEIMATAPNSLYNHGGMALSTWNNLGTAQTLTLTASSAQAASLAFSIQIRKVGTTTVLDTATITLAVDTSAAGGGTTTGGGGGGGGCVVVDTILPGYEKAEHVNVGDQLMLGNPLTYETRYGDVTYAAPEPQFCYRVETGLGVVLECSDSAPIATVDGTIVKPGVALGANVPVQIDGEWFEDQIISVTPLGTRMVMKITCENDFFLAGANEGKYLLHHNSLVHKV